MLLRIENLLIWKGERQVIHTLPGVKTSASVSVTEANIRKIEIPKEAVAKAGGGYLRIVASLSGPTPIHFTGTPAAASIIVI